VEILDVYPEFYDIQRGDNSRDFGFEIVGFHFFGSFFCLLQTEMCTATSSFLTLQDTARGKKSSGTFVVRIDFDGIRNDISK
jgi:hypothetical protein